MDKKQTNANETKDKTPQKTNKGTKDNNDVKAKSKLSQEELKKVSGGYGGADQG